MLSFRMSFYVLNRFHGEGAVGIYSNGISLVQYARISNTEDRDYSQKLTVQLSKASTVLSLFIVVV